MIVLTFKGRVVKCADGIRRLQVENKSYPGQVFSGEDVDLLFKMFPDARLTATFAIEASEPTVPEGVL